jgi:hypothetical protein
MHDLRTIMAMNAVPEINPDRMGFEICTTLDEKTAEIRDILDTVQGMQPIDADHNGDATITIFRKLKIAILTLGIHMRIGGEDLAFLKGLEVEMRDLLHEILSQSENLETKINNKTNS